VIFPEGGIVTTEFPRMARFKDGAFKLSVDKQIPIVPVTIATNWILLPGELGDLNWHPIRVIFHEPIYPEGKDESILRKEVYEIIDAELRTAATLYKNEN
jgi:1-acyl-sn-glycerol-3-phosphate acyltransferase